MPINGFNTGRDVSIVVTMPSGLVRLANVTMFEAKQRTKQTESHGIDGVDRFQEIPSGWEGTIELDRANANADIAIDFLEGLYHSGANVPGSTISEVIQEPQGGVTEWQFVGVMFKFDDHGSWRGDNKVTQKLSWVASSRKRLQ